MSADPAIIDELTPRATVELLGRLLATLGAAAQPASPELQAEGLAAPDAARLLGISTSAFYDLDSRGLVPTAVTLGDGKTLRRWRRSELIAWLAAGAPARARWEMIKSRGAK